MILGLYAYRRGGIPAFLPPGHGLVYLGGARLTQTASVRAHARGSIDAAAAGGALWALGTPVLGRPTDMAGALATVALLAFLARGPRAGPVRVHVRGRRRPRALEDPDGRPGVAGALARAAARHGNPPSGVAAGYCATDAVALRLAPPVEHVLARASAAARRIATAAALRRIAPAPGR